MFKYLSRTFASLGLFGRAFGRYRRTVFVLTGLGFLSGILGGFGIGAIVPLFSFVARQGTADDMVTKIFRETLQFFGIPFSLPFVISVLVLLFIAKALFLYVANIVNAKAVADYTMATRSELFDNTMRAKWQYLLDRKVGHLTQVMSEDVDLSAGVLVSISVFIIFFTSFISYAAIALTISPYITIATIAIGIILSIFIKPVLYKIRQIIGRETVLRKDVAHMINQHLIGSKTVKSMIVESSVIQLGREKFRELSRRKMSVLRHQAVMATFLEPLTLAVIIPIFLFSYRNPEFNIASFAAVLYLVQKMFSFVQSMQLRLGAINEGIPHLSAVVQCQEEIRQYQERQAGLDHFEFHSTIRLENVNFSYGNGDRLFDALNLTIRKGEMVGLVGQSGSGKTTVADLLLRLFEPSGGTIMVDGMNVSDINLYVWRSKIGYVSQDMFLLNDTIAKNIRFYDESITDDDIEQAAKLAHIYDFIEQRPEKFNAVVGERGVKLSAGQRQRIVLARMIARKPEILILDEATSALDNESEVAIKNSLENLRGKVTMLVIAHRLSTVMSSDRIAFLEGGAIAEEGSPEELLKNKDSRFFNMYHIQK
ncbi:MAG: ABC transporter ATP-binding protein [Candidatus Yanofskybacteria bacterium]|nr:ABC transporter ATP-binding protein [Candidatus Yanofskybacteria bacterium]